VFDDAWLKDKEISFVDIACGTAGGNPTAYGLTNSGILVSFDLNRKEPAKWVSLKVNAFVHSPF
jgi:hypothetical protein